MTWVVIGGWSIPPDMLSPIFGCDSIFVDANALMPELLDDETAAADWPRRAASIIAARRPQAVTRLAGWSAGAIIAHATASLLNPEQVILLAATRSFCRRPGWRWGMPPAVVDRMIQGLWQNRTSVLESFSINAALPPLCGVCPYETETLAAGLRFLQTASLFPAAPAPEHALFLHGADDRIIPPAAGKQAAYEAGAPWRALDGGHGFVFERSDEIKALIAAQC